MNKLLQFLKTTMIGGLIFLVPLVVLVVVVDKALGWLQALAQPLAGVLPINTLAGLAIANLVGLALLVVACFFAGLAARTPTVQRLRKRAEDRILSKIPGYDLLKALSDNLQHKEPSDERMHPVLMKLDDAAQLAFEVERLEDGRVVLYVPGAPQPQSGDLLIVDSARVEALPASMATAVRCVTAFGSGMRAFVGRKPTD